MAMNQRPSINKRNREQALRERAQEKNQRREDRAQRKKNRGELGEGDDPDIAGIVPGPQPKSDE
jgi:hypothetical protein